MPFLFGFTVFYKGFLIFPSSMNIWRVPFPNKFVISYYLSKRNNGSAIIKVNITAKHFSDLFCRCT